MRSQLEGSLGPKLVSIYLSVDAETNGLRLNGNPDPKLPRTVALHGSMTVGFRIVTIPRSVIVSVTTQWEVICVATVPMFVS